MRKCLPCIAWFLMLATAAVAATPPKLGIIPAPVSVEMHRGTFTLKESTKLIAKGEDAQHVARMLNAFLSHEYGFTLPVSAEGSADNSILLDAKAQNTPAEGYHLDIAKTGIQIHGADGPGLYHGLQSLLQMLPVEKQASYTLPAASIYDYPRFSYRGMHLDCGRHFFPVSFIKEYLDLMARYKYNSFHWHLTEDQGWRIEIKKYPRLTQIGSQRTQTVIGHNTPDYDGKPYGGYYTQEDIREVVKYATDRFITVIPEIEMPGHALAALTAYPMLGCTSGPYQVGTKWGVFKDVFCPGKESTFQFLENVLTEVMELFPSHYIHIGGDECPKDRWKSCPYCQKRIKALGLHNEEELQSYVVTRIEKFLNAHGREIIGWDEILEGGLAPNATVMSWRGEKGGIAAAQQKHDVIMTPGAWCYFDHAQSRDPQEPLNIGGYVPISKVYSYNPVPEALSAAEQPYIIGVQANLWSEYIPSVQQAEYMVMPRMMAMAEVAWTPLKQKDYGSFNARLPRQLHYLDRQGVHFRIPEPGGFQSDSSAGKRVIVKLQAPFPGTRIYYTTDGSEPTAQSALYQDPIHLSLEDQPEATLRLIEVTPSGNTSVIYSATYQRQKS